VPVINEAEMTEWLVCIEWEERPIRCVELGGE